MHNFAEQVTNLSSFRCTLDDVNFADEDDGACIERFIVNKIGCRTPWGRPHGATAFCNDTQTEAYNALQEAIIIKGDAMEIYLKTGCMQKCQR